MADYKHSRHKSSKSIDHESSKTKSKFNVKDSKKSSKASHKTIRSNTPPLKTRRSSIDDLIKQRDTLKQELKRFIKHSDGDLNKHSTTSNQNRKHSRSDTHNQKSRKRQGADDVSSVKRRKNSNKESSPDLNGDYAQDSEDEETIIEKRRLERKKLMEKLNQSHNSKTIDKEPSKNIENINENEVEVTKGNVNPDNQTKTTDMFSENDNFINKTAPDQVTQDNDENKQLTDNWDDAEGYYNIREGDIFCNNKYTIKSILGKGVFANVVSAQENTLKQEVAIKIIRNNELMYRTGLKEILMLNKIRQADPQDKYHCIRFLTHFTYKSHLCIILESLHMDMRSVIKKYGKHHGLNIKALISYSRQLLIALRLLKKIGVIHADIKPDNILVNEKKNVLKLCDFGSATMVDDNEATPYLVSRFYRAPEIILGVPYKHGVDIWSAACTIYEIATGKIMFMGTSNNRMLKCFMDLKGKFPSRVLRKGKFKDQHFNYNNNFLLRRTDDFSGREKVAEITNITITRDLQKELNKAHKNATPAEEKKLIQLKDLLDRMLILDTNVRPSPTDCLKHPFIQEEYHLK